ncbi:hypothetical protein RUS48_04195 [Mycoplasmoides gallisepticum]|nr:hypothetical protein RUS48_04195 [Mycoplasmoides gallisepticum]
MKQVTKLPIIIAKKKNDKPQAKPCGRLDDTANKKPTIGPPCAAAQVTPNAPAIAPATADPTTFEMIAF